ncbi:TPA: transcriptional regulator [Vibrio vulnificus]
MSKKLLIGDWVLDIELGTIHYRHSPDKVRKLTKKLLQFITVLYEANGDVLDKKLIVDRVWDGKTSSENITQTVNKLRGIFEDHKKILIVNHPGKGYSLNFSIIEDSPIEADNQSKKLREKRIWLNANKTLPSRLRFVMAAMLTFLCLSHSGYNVINGFRLDPIHKLDVTGTQSIIGCHLDSVSKVLLCE